MSAQTDEGTRVDHPQLTLPADLRAAIAALGVVVPVVRETKPAPWMPAKPGEDPPF